MKNTLSILVAQCNPTLGAITKNTQQILSVINTYQETHQVILFPELMISGYPPEDLLFRHDFHEAIKEGLDNIAQKTQNCYVIVGHPHWEEPHCFNAASVFYQGKRIALYYKQKLPNYGVFDEERYFSPGNIPCILSIQGYKFGLLICEDLWQPGPTETLLASKVDGIFCINGSPFDTSKYQSRSLLLQRYSQQGVAIFYVNMVGGQDEFLFDGTSVAFDHQGNLQARLPSFQECYETIHFTKGKLQGKQAPLLTEEAMIYQALVLGTRDYVEKNGFSGVLLGLSGGIDSALTLAIAYDALGKENVHAVMMPSRYTSTISKEDALCMIQTLQVESSTFSIEEVFLSSLHTLSLASSASSITEENMQARIRGLFLMALSNKTGKLVLTTSNKSETAVGYTTLYGDMAGGFSVLKDVLKTKVYALAHYRNSLSFIIPTRVLTRAPSAELREHQKDQDSLPPYEELDALLFAYIEKGASQKELLHQGFSKEIVEKILSLIQKNEHKRKQAPPGIRISTRAFGRDWRYPITSQWQSP